MYNIPVGIGLLSKKHAVMITSKLSPLKITTTHSPVWRLVVDTTHKCFIDSTTPVPPNASVYIIYAIQESPIDTLL